MRFRRDGTLKPKRTIDHFVPAGCFLWCCSFRKSHGGTSVLLYRDAALRSRQYFASTEWPGGLYLSPGLAGSRSGGLIASTWAAMVTMGREGYLDRARAILATNDSIKSGIRESISELQVIGDPLFMTSFMSSPEAGLDVYLVNDALKERGWRMNSLQLPPALHFCVTGPNTQPGVAGDFLADLRVAVPCTASARCPTATRRCAW